MTQDPAKKPNPVQFALLVKLRSPGPEEVQRLGEQVRNMQQAMETIGGEMTAIITLGEYDIVAMGEAQTDEQLAWFSSTLAANAGVAVETLRGFTPEEWTGLQAEPELHTMLPFHW